MCVNKINSIVKQFKCSNISASDLEVATFYVGEDGDHNNVNFVYIFYRFEVQDICLATFNM